MSDCRFGVSPVNYPDPGPLGKKGYDLSNSCLNMFRWLNTFFLHKNPQDRPLLVNVTLRDITCCNFGISNLS